MVCQMTDVQVLVLFVGCLVAAWLQLVCWCVAVMILDRYIITATWCFCVFYTEKLQRPGAPKENNKTRLLCVPLSLLFVAFIAFSVQHEPGAAQPVEASCSLRIGVTFSEQG